MTARTWLLLALGVASTLTAAQPTEGPASSGPAVRLCGHDEACPFATQTSAHDEACPAATATMPATQPATRPTTRPTTRPATQPAGPVAPPHVRAAMNELWRRGFCLLSSVYEPAEKESAVPKDVGNVPVLAPRVIGRRAALLCYAVDGQTLWAADDQSLYQADGSAGKLTRRFTPADGLPAAPIQSMAASGDSLFLASRSGLARLDKATGRIEPVAGVAVEMGVLVRGGGRVWLLGDGGAFVTQDGRNEWRKLPDYPGQAQLAQVVRRGFWTATWHDRLRSLLPAAVANEDGFCAICSNRLIRYDPAADKWTTVCEPAWELTAQGRVIWAMTTGGIVRHDGPAGKSQTFKSGQPDGPSAGRSVAMAANESAFYLLSQPTYDSKLARFVGGGVSRYDAAAARWTITEQVDGVDVRFATAVTADREGAAVACKLYDGATQLGAHPGMAFVKKWVPQINGLGLLCSRGEHWQLVSRTNLKTERRWVLGQKGTLGQDDIGPDTVVGLCRAGSAVWGVYQMVPRQWYSGYYVSAGCLAEESSGQWQGRFDVRTEELGLAGEQPEVLLLSQSHGPQFVLAEGQCDMLGIEQVGGRVWAICQNGLYAHDPATGRFQAVAPTGFRAYWAVTAALASQTGVWFAGDGGTVSRLDRATGLLALVGVAEGRKVTGLSPAGQAVRVATAAADVCLPAELGAAARLAKADSFVLGVPGDAPDASGPVNPPAKARFACKGNYVVHGDRKVAFLKGVFKPTVLCEDAVGGLLWLATYDGVASIPLPPEPVSKPDE